LKLLKLLLLTALLFTTTQANDDRPPIDYNFLAKNEVRNFIDMMVKKHHFERSYITSVLKHAKLDRDTLARYTGKFKKNTTIGTWERFKLHVVNQEEPLKKDTTTHSNVQRKFIK